MKRVFGLVAALALGLGAFAPIALADGGLAHTGRVLISAQGDVTVPAGQHADFVMVVQGNADIRGEVNALVVLDGTATLTGATLETVAAVGSHVEVRGDTVVLGEIQHLDTTIHQTGNPRIEGGIVDLAPRLLEFSGALATALLLLWIGFGITNIVAGLFLAGVAAKQLRAAERVIAAEPVLAFVAGLLATLIIPIGAVLLFPTVVLAPLGFGILVVALPLIAFGGYLVAAAWLGEWLLKAVSSGPERERPYLATVLGVVALGAIGLIPVLGFLVAIASVLGFGAVIVRGLRTITGGARSIGPAAQPHAAPTAA